MELFEEFPWDWNTNYDTNNEQLLHYLNNNLYIETTDDKQNICQELEFVHGNVGSQPKKSFPLRKESEGTCRIVAIHMSLFCKRQYDEQSFTTELPTQKTVIIDEMECSLHPIIVLEMIKDLLSSKEYESTQMIATTHELNIIKKEFMGKYLDRDAIWCVDRNNKKADEPSIIYSLLEFKEKDPESYDAAYTSGKYGAAPHITLDLDNEVE